MLKQGILNPNINSLLSRVRHTNTLVIADRGFPYWPAIETIDISLTDNVPRVLDVLRAVQAACNFGAAYMAEEFRSVNESSIELELRTVLGRMPLNFEPHIQFKKRVPLAIGLIRTGDTIQYSNIILESA
ncbi:MAG: RbsD/FucU domain-containing protein [Terriglobales bacterium]